MKGDKYKPERKALLSATEMEAIKHKLLASSYTSTGADMRKLFAMMDRDGEGEDIDCKMFSLTSTLTLNLIGRWC